MASFSVLQIHSKAQSHQKDSSAVEGKLLKGNRNAIYFIQKDKKRLIPDFYTFSHMGFNLTSIEKVSDDFLADLPLGDAIKPIPVFRPEDYMYHKNCEDPDKMVSVWDNFEFVYVCMYVCMNMRGKLVIFILVIRTDLLHLNLSNYTCINAYMYVQ